MPRLRRDSAYIKPQHFSDDDDDEEETVNDSDSDSLNNNNKFVSNNVVLPMIMPIAEAEEVKMNSSSSKSHKPKLRKTSSLSLTSKKYDLDGDGILNEAEQAMRNMDASSRGYLTKHEIYTIVQEQLRQRKKAGYLRRLIAGLICFVILLSCSNLGTSWGAAVLAKDLKADDGVVVEGGGDNDGSSESLLPPAMRIVSTGEIAAAQSTADVYLATEMTEEQLQSRRTLVLAEMEEDPHSHNHRRRNLAASCYQCRARDCTLQCNSPSQKYITFDSSTIPDEEFEIIQEKCSKQKNVYLKRKWGDDTNNGRSVNSRNEAICSRGTSVTVKTKKKNKKNKDKNGNSNKKKDKRNKKGKYTDREVIIEQQNGVVLHVDCLNGLCYAGGTVLQGGRGDDCRIGADECQTDYVCQRSSSSNQNLRSNGIMQDRSLRYGTCTRPTVEMTDIVNERNAPVGGYCNVAKGWDACDNGYYCLVDNDNDDNGYDISFGLQVLKNRSNRQDYNVGNNGKSVVGTCVATVGYGQTCPSDYACGRKNYCDVGGSHVVGRARDSVSYGVCTRKS